MSITLFFISILGGIASGLLGVGGAVVLIPLMLSLPPLFGVGQLSMNEVAGITMIQVLVSSIFGFLTHKKGGQAHNRTIIFIGIPMGLCSLAGALLSKYMNEKSMLVIFGLLVAVAFVLLLKKSPGERNNEQSDFNFNGTLSVIVGSLVGLSAGIIGAGGGFIIIPLMLQILKIPMRVTVGSSLGIVFIGALMGSIGKLITLQVNADYLLPVIAGSIPAAIIGAKISKKIPNVYLRYILCTVVFLIMVKTWSAIIF